jgi:uncharacterized protein (TIGR02246 family)
MPELRVDDVQILLLEMQPAIVAASETVPGKALRRGAGALRSIAHAAGIPIHASVVPLGDTSSRLIDELAGVEARPRATVGALDDPAVAATLEVAGRRTLILGGVSSEIAVLRAALGGLAAGYSVHVLVDLCGGLKARTEAAAFQRMSATGAILSSVASFATALFDDMSTSLGQSIMQTLSQHLGWSAHEAGGAEDPDDAAIETLFAELKAGWQAGDAHRFAAAFSPNARFVAFDGTVLTGPDSIAAYHAHPFATYLAGSTLALEHLTFRQVAPGVHAAASEGGILREDRTEGELIGRSAQTFLIERRDGPMRITSFQNTRVRPIDGPGAAEIWKRFDEDWGRRAR